MRGRRRWSGRRRAAARPRRRSARALEWCLAQCSAAQRSAGQHNCVHGCPACTLWPLVLGVFGVWRLQHVAPLLREGPVRLCSAPHSFLPGKNAMVEVWHSLELILQGSLCRQHSFSSRRSSAHRNSCRDRCMVHVRGFWRRFRPRPGPHTWAFTSPSPKVHTLNPSPPPSLPTLPRRSQTQTQHARELTTTT